MVALGALMLQACAMNPPEPAATPVDDSLGMVDELVAPGGNRAKAPVEQVVVPDEAPTKKKEVPEITQLGTLPPMPTTSEVAPPISVSPQDDVVQLDYDQVELRAVMEEIADALGISLVIDPSIADTVTLRTAPDRPLHHADLWPLLRLLMTSASVNLEKRGEVYYAKKQNPIIPMEIGPAGSFDSANGAVVLQVTPLRHATIEAALAVLKPMVEPGGGYIVTLPNLNMLAIFDAPERLERVNQMLKLIDADPFARRGLHLYPLKYAKAADVVKDLTGIITAVEGATSSFQIVSLDRINAVLVVSPPNRGFAEIDRWIRILDSGEGEGGERVFIYKVKNLEAKALASTLSEVFKNKEDTAKAAVAAAVPEPKIVKEPAAEEQGKAPPKNLAEAAQQVAQQAAEPAPAAPTAVSASASLQVSIVADEDTNSLLVRALPRDYKQLLETIAELDLPSREVMINVVIAEVTLDNTNRFGIEWELLNGTGRTKLSTNFGVASAVGDGTGAGLVFNQLGNRLNLLLNYLDSKTATRVLSRPSILVRDNQEAVIKVGSEEPVLTRITSSDTTATSSSTLYNDVQYRDTGIILTVTPHISEDGIINLDVHQEISQVGKDATSLGLPYFTNREVQTSAVVRDGAALILGGIIQDKHTDENAGLAGLKDLPGIGSLFSNDSKSTERTELALIIVPQLINPREDNSEAMGRIYRRLKEAARLLNDHGIDGLGWN
ncbi:type II secretion system secretin GspD [Endothiovibrio diazotrophicus]